MVVFVPLLIGAAALGGVGGVGAGVKGVVDAHKAQGLNENTAARQRIAAQNLETLREECGRMLDELGLEKINVLDTSMKHFLDSFSKLKNVELRDSIGLDELKRLHIDEASFEELRKLSNMAVEIVKGGIAGLAAGSLTAFGAYGLAMHFATASTGAAIAGLHGAAATNATLAFFGGGALAAGGMGMAGGMAVLGGLMAGPALLVFGAMVGLNGMKNLEQAKADAAQVNVYCEQWAAATDLSRAIRDRAMMFYATLAQLDVRFSIALRNLDRIIASQGEDYAQFGQEAKQSVAACVSLAMSIKSVLDTPILDDSGTLTDESGVLVRKFEQNADE
ncbi:hypothetical protein CQR46_0092 [Bifidobacterium pseudolongum subsp. globosum]|uniref:Chemotaxis protein n=1 Tax=Bifidobacterium pseudolongum subsp. globosum TaxID=1690 RepID=A0A2N3QLE9_9BIFI|nr:hypothetical protein [Bifidobacterium pseudolongum]PKU92516.1 hypothetical protein CQR46_0092 [Bifidobacterium pseudolongum subsp. globosum]